MTLNQEKRFGKENLDYTTSFSGGNVWWKLYAKIDLLSYDIGIALSENSPFSGSSLKKSSEMTFGKVQDLYDVLGQIWSFKIKA